jgi:pimeloyl-ACP methyl ester carboxylesterase
MRQLTRATMCMPSARVLRSVPAPLAWEGLAATSHFVEASATHKLHLLQIRSTDVLPVHAPAVFCLHGAVDNGQMFYSKRGRYACCTSSSAPLRSRPPRGHRGLAPFLARQGFDVFVGDLRGRGQSIPTLAQEREPTHGQTEYIRDDIPLFASAVAQISQQQKQHWIGHSWGGVLLASAVCRSPVLATVVKSQVWAQVVLRLCT